MLAGAQQHSQSAEEPLRILTKELWSTRREQRLSEAAADIFSDSVVVSASGKQLLLQALSRRLQ